MTKSKSWSKFMLSLLATSLLFSACKKEYSKDDPLPSVYSPSIVVGSDNQILYAFNPSDGSKNWELSLATPIISSPMLYGNMIYVANSTTDTIYKINAKTGAIVKKITYSGGGAGATACLIADANLIYVATLGGALMAIDTGSYDTKWSYNPGTGANQSSPTIYNGKIYYASTGGHVYCLDKTKGPEIVGGAPFAFWDYVTPSGTTKFTSSPAVAKPYLYIGGANDSNMYCIYLDSINNFSSTAPYGCAARWIYKAQGNIASSPAAYGGNCIFGCNDFNVYCIDTIIDPVMGITTPSPRWVKRVGSEVTSSPYASGQTVYVGCKDYNLYALNILNGTVKWAFATNGIVTSSPIVYKGTIYVGSYDKYLYAVDSTKGTMKWSKNVNGQIGCSPVIDDFSSISGFNSQISGFTN